jgi:polar amino acid transport system ATP-binding protein
MSAAMVRLEAVRKRFGGLDVLKDVSLGVGAGQVVCVVGPSGAGKSTLLRCVNHLEKIDAGRIWVDGELVGYRQEGEKLYELPEAEICRKRAEVGMVFQQFNLFRHMTVLQNLIEAPTCVKGVARAAATARAQDLLEKVGLSDKLRSRPDELSGGQRQRVAIARALAMEPKLMLFDEPTSALDPELVGGVLDVIRELAEEGMTMMIVTHEIGFAREVADTVVFLDRGVVVESGDARALIADARQERTRAFLSKVL